MINKLQIQCSSIALKKDEMLSLIPSNVKSQLALFDSNYESKLKPYTLCHEGDARPSIFEGNSKKAIVMRWTKDTVKGFISKLKTGLQFFDGHNPTNDKQTNNVLGSLVAFGEKVINGVTSAIGIGYFPEPVESMDVISAEFDVFNDGLIDNGNFFTVLSDAIGDITGLALGSRSKGMKPAFPGAESLQVQAFEFINTNEENNKEKNLATTKEELLNSLSIDDIKGVVRDRGLRITQVFESNSLFRVDENEDGTRKIKFSDDSLNKALKDHMKDSVIIPKNKIDSFTELEKKYGNLEKSYGEAKPYFVKSKAAEAFQEIAKAKNLEQNKDKFSYIENKVKKSIDKYQGDISLLNKHIESQVDEYSNDFEETIKVLSKSGFQQPLSSGAPPLNGANPANDKYTL